MSVSPAPTEDARKPCKEAGRLGVTLLITYALTLVLGTIVASPAIGLVPATLDRELDSAAEVVRLGPEEERRAASVLLVAHHEFSIPHLLNALDRASPDERDAVTSVLARIATTYFRLRPSQLEKMNAAAWRDWWATARMGVGNAE
jgi:hypothetical protein